MPHHTAPGREGNRAEPQDQTQRSRCVDGLQSTESTDAKQKRQKMLQCMEDFEDTPVTSQQHAAGQSCSPSTEAAQGDFWLAANAIKDLVSGFHDCLNTGTVSIASDLDAAISELVKEGEALVQSTLAEAKAEEQKAENAMLTVQHMHEILSISPATSVPSEKPAQL